VTRPLIAVLDYGIGNLHSAQKALEKMGADAHLTVDPGLVAPLLEQEPGQRFGLGAELRRPVGRRGCGAEALPGLPGAAAQQLESGVDDAGE